MVLSSHVRQNQSRRECGWLLSLNGTLLFTLLSPFTLSFDILSKVNRIIMTVKAFPVTYKNESRGTWSTLGAARRRKPAGWNYVLEYQKSRLREFPISNFSSGGGGGAYSHTLLLEGCVALQNAMIAAQAYFTSATHLVQIDHTPFTFLIITLAHQ